MERANQNSGKLVCAKDLASMGWTMRLRSEAVSDMVKAVENHAATKTWLQWAAEHVTVKL